MQEQGISEGTALFAVLDDFFDNVRQDSTLPVSLNIQAGIAHEALHGRDSLEPYPD